MNFDDLTFGAGREWSKRILRLVFFLIPSVIALLWLVIVWLDGDWDDGRIDKDLAIVLFFDLMWVLIGVIISYVRAGLVKSSSGN